METRPNQTLYELLEVTPDAPQEEIHSAFLRAKTTYSPNSPALYSIFSREEADQLLKLIDEAYSVLGNPIRRREYDHSLRIVLEPTPASAPAAVSSPPAKPFSSEKTIGKTAFSHYEIDPAFEEQIKFQEIFDGSFLQKIRDYKKVTVDQMATSTRIGRNYLVAIEANDFLSLPATVFVRGFIQQIARVLGLDQKKTVESYMKIVKDSRGS